MGFVGPVVLLLGLVGLPVVLLLGLVGLPVGLPVELLLGLVEFVGLLSRSS